MLRPVAVAATAFLVSGCATAYSPLYSPAEVAQTAKARAATSNFYRKKDGSLPTSPAVATCEGRADGRDARLAQTLACAEVLQYVYSNGYRDISAWRDIATLPVIGGAGAGALILLNGKDEAAKRAGKVGIGVGVIAAIRDQFWPSSLPLSFIKGHAALGCVIAEGEYFHGTPASDVHGAMMKRLSALTLLSVDMARLRATFPAVKPKPTASEEAQLKATQAVADQALALANEQIGTSATESTAYEFANSAFRKAVTDVGAWVASRGRDRPDFSYQDFVGKYAPTDDSTERALLDRPPPSPLPIQQLITDLATTTQELIVATRLLKAATPDYKERIAHVGKCATGLPSE